MGLFLIQILNLGSNQRLSLWKFTLQLTIKVLQKIISSCIKGLEGTFLISLNRKNQKYGLSFWVENRFQKWALFEFVIFVEFYCKSSKNRLFFLSYGRFTKAMKHNRGLELECIFFNCCIYYGWWYVYFPAC